MPPAGNIKLKELETTAVSSTLLSSKKEVFQPHLPIRLPCYDLAPVTSFTLGGSLRLPTLGTPGFHGLTGGVYKVRERIHRIIADIRLLAIPASCSRVADCNLN
jgi:hypothetical protein